jgi:hypothetical protein
MSNILNSLRSLKEKINDIQSLNVNNKETNIQEEPENKIIDNNKILADNLAHLKLMQKSKIEINVGGIVYSISSITLKNTLYENIFSNLEQKKIFYDGNPFLFKYVAFVLRNLSKNVADDFQLDVKILYNDDEVVIREMLKEIFSKNETEILSKVKFIREIIKIQPDSNDHINVDHDNVGANANNDYDDDDRGAAENYDGYSE